MIMNRFFRCIVITVIFGAVTLLAGWMVRVTMNEKPVSTLSVIEPAVIDHLPTIVDVQRKLNAMGYVIAVDGRLGPETQKAWDAALMKRLASDQHP